MDKYQKRVVLYLLVLLLILVSLADVNEIVQSLHIIVAGIIAALVAWCIFLIFGKE